MAPSTKTRRFPISLAMIVRDEEANLGRCLASVQGLVDEIVVVDTGSTDRTIDIARSYGAKVHHFDWIDDFAAARNHALSLTTHPWRLVLDADEWIIDRSTAKRVLDEVGVSVPDHACGIDWFQADERGELNADALPQSLVRLLPAHLTYTGRVHEQPTPTIRAVRIGLAVGHDGYTDDALARKDGRNTSLLVAALDEDPDNASLWYLLANEYVGRDQPEEALPYLVRAYNLLHPADPAAAPTKADWWHRVTLRLLMALTETGRHEDAVALGEIEAASWPDSADLHYVLGGAVRALAVRLRETDRARAEELMVASLGLWIHASQMTDQQRYAGILAGRGTALAAARVAEHYAATGQVAEAERYRAIAGTRG